MPRLGSKGKANKNGRNWEKGKKKKKETRTFLVKIKMEKNEKGVNGVHYRCEEYRDVLGDHVKYIIWRGKFRILYNLDTSNNYIYTIDLIFQLSLSTMKI